MTGEGVGCMGASQDFIMSLVPFSNLKSSATVFLRQLQA